MAWWGRRVWHLSRWRTACVVLYFTDGANSPVRFLFLSPSLSVIMNKITLVTDWWNHDGLQGWFQRFILAERWPSVSAATVFPLILWPFACATFPSGYFAKWGLPLRQEMWYTQLDRVYFWSEEEVWVGEKVCATVFPLPALEVWGSGEKAPSSSSDRIMRLLKGTLKKK